MSIWLGLGYIWWIGVRDVLLSRLLIETAGAQAELNFAARWVVQAFGLSALGWFKLVLLLVFTVLVLFIDRKHERAGRFAVAAGILIYSALSMWWDFALLSPLAGW